MNKRKVIAAALLFCLLFTMSGCSSDKEENLKDSILNGFNDFLHHFSTEALTDNRDLQGERKAGIDTYTGAYSAEYDNFDDTEYLFGGTGLEREDGNGLTITYKLEITQGKAELYWRNKDRDAVIAEKSDAGTYHITLNSGDDYLILEGDGFTGSLQVTVE